MKKYYLLVLIFLLSYSLGFSKSKDYGLSVSYDFLKHTTFTGLCQKGYVGEDIYNSGISIGGFMEFPVFNDAMIMQLKLNYDYLPMYHEFKSTPTTTDNILVNGKPIIYGNQVDSKYLSSSNYSLLSGDLFFKASLTEIAKKLSKLNIIFGPSLGLSVMKHFYLEHKIYSPQNARFESSITYKLADNDKTKIISDSEIPDVNAFRLSLNFGLEYNIIYPKFVLSPYLIYNFGLNSVVNADENSWSLEYWRFGINLTFKRSK